MQLYWCCSHAAARPITPTPCHIQGPFRITVLLPEAHRYEGSSRGLTSVGDTALLPEAHRYEGSSRGLTSVGETALLPIVTSVKFSEACSDSAYAVPIVSPPTPNPHPPRCLSNHTHALPHPRSIPHRSHAARGPQKEVVVGTEGSGGGLTSEGDTALLPCRIGEIQLIDFNIRASPLCPELFEPRPSRRPAFRRTNHCAIASRLPVLL